MNVLKALAKMTKIASGLQDNWDHSLRELETLREKYDDTVRVATERYDLIKSLEAKLHAAEEKAKVVPPPIYALAEKLVKSLGYSFDHATGWTHPPVTPTTPDFRATSAEKKLGELGYSWLINQWVGTPPKAATAPTIDWESEPWATHYLTAPGQRVFAELVDGVYQGAPRTDLGHWRLCFHVGLGASDFKVLATRPGYTGPLTRGAEE